MKKPEAMDVLTVGEAMTLLIAQESGPLDAVPHFARATAGAELNVAVGLARLGFEVGYLSRLGDDSFGRHLLGFMAREKIRTEFIQVDGRHPTGMMLKSLAVDGSDPAIEYFRRGSAASHLGPADLPVAAFATTRHLHLTGISPALSDATCELVFEMAHAARRAGMTISFDPNLRPRLWSSDAVMRETLNRLASLCDWILPGQSEGRLLSGHADPQGIADFYLASGAKAVFVKLGPEGAFHADPNGRGFVPGVAVARVVDTVGAGDAFAVGVVSALLEGLSHRQAAARGAWMGARNTQFPGDCDGLPTRAELDLTRSP